MFVYGFIVVVMYGLFDLCHQFRERRNVPVYQIFVLEVLIDSFCISIILSTQCNTNFTLILI